MTEIAGNSASWIQALTILGGWWLLFLFVVPFAYPRILAQAAPMGIEAGLSFWEKVWIFILYLIAVILGIIAAVSAASVAFWLIIVAGFFTLLATFWWLFEFMVWPWEREFWELFFSAPWWAYLLGLLVLIPVALLVAILLGAGGWVLVLIAAIVALLWLGLVFRCGWIVWIETRLSRLWKWWVEVFWDFIEVVRRVINAEERWFTEERRRWIQIWDRRCASWHWAFKWICSAFEFVVVGVSLVIEYVVVKVIVYIVSLIIVVLWVIVTIVVGILLIVILFILKAIFWCW